MPTLRSPWTRLALSAVLATAVSGAALAANKIWVPQAGNPLANCSSSPANPNSARFGQFCGAEVDLDGATATPAFVQDNSPAAEGTYNVRFYVNLRNLVLGSGDSMDLFGAYADADIAASSTPTLPVFRVVITNTGGIKELTLVVHTTGGDVTSTPAVQIDNGWRSVEVHWTAGAGSGAVQLWLNGTAKSLSNMASLTNNDRSVNMVRWGAVAGTNANIGSGSFTLDDFASQRSGNIGPSFPFSDVAQDGYWPFITSVYSAGVLGIDTSECAVGTFCGLNNLNREQMAKAMLLALYGGGHVPPPCTTPTYQDVPCSDPYAPWVDEFATLGITGGCNVSPPLYCPTNPISRTEMAVFMVIGVTHAGAPACDANTNPTAFPGDVPNSDTYCGFIKKFSTLGITGGCGGTNFCPTANVNRTSMAVFLRQGYQSQNPDLVVMPAIGP